MFLGRDVEFKRLQKTKETPIIKLLSKLPIAGLG